MRTARLERASAGCATVCWCRDEEARLAAYERLLPALLRAIERALEGTDAMIEAELLGQTFAVFGEGALRLGAGGLMSSGGFAGAGARSLLPRSRPASACACKLLLCVM